MPELLDCGHAPDKGEPANVNGQTVQGWQFVLDFDGKRKICRACADARILDCGHTPSAHSSMTTGYGTDEHGKRQCYACCAERERARMIETGRATLYLVGPKAGQINMRVTDWPGHLEFIAWGLQRSPRGGGFGAQRTDAWFTGPDGYVWHAVNRGDNQIARCKRTKEKA
jgi:hypothetical protein